LIDQKTIGNARDLGYVHAVAEKQSAGVLRRQLFEPGALPRVAIGIDVRDIVRDHRDGLALREKPAHTGPQCTE